MQSDRSRLKVTTIAEPKSTGALVAEREERRLRVDYCSGGVDEGVQYVTSVYTHIRSQRHVRGPRVVPFKVKPGEWDYGNLSGHRYECIYKNNLF